MKMLATRMVAKCEACVGMQNTV
eukprot:COSAG02_NODE_58543_length_277_cov_0.578652_1_plen_22_part_01